MNDTPKHLFIATKNEKKYKSISRSLNLIDKNILVQKINETVPDCREIGSDSHENAKIKAKHFHYFTNENTLSEDDSIFFDNLPKQDQPGHLVKRKPNKTINKKEFWEHFIKNNNLKSGKLIKHFCLITRTGKINHCKVKIPFTVKFSDKAANFINPLNNFMIPKGFKKTFAVMSKEEKIKFSKVYICPKLAVLLNNLN
jgi:inosine/xanthosine triphosphate pyrophosphatase family protein